MSENNWAKPGLEVIHCNTRWRRSWGDTARIEKVYKNGRFVLEGYSQQYRPTRDGWARQTGSHYSYNQIALLTDELRKEIEGERKAEERKSRMFELAKEVEGLAREHPIDEEIDAKAQAFLAALTAWKQERTAKE